MCACNVAATEGKSNILIIDYSLLILQCSSRFEIRQKNYCDADIIVSVSGFEPWNYAQISSSLIFFFIISNPVVASFMSQQIGLKKIILKHDPDYE